MCILLCEQMVDYFIPPVYIWMATQAIPYLYTLDRYILHIAETSVALPCQTKTALVEQKSEVTFTFLFGVSPPKKHQTNKIKKSLIIESYSWHGHKVFLI